MHKKRWAALLAAAVLVLTGCSFGSLGGGGGSSVQKIDRLTMTLPVFNNSRCCMFMVTGKDKHAVLSRALDLLDKPELPAQLVHPAVGDLIWVVDEAAATGGKE